MRAQILASVEGGMSLHATLKPKGMPDRKTVRDYGKTDLEFARRLAEARASFDPHKQKATTRRRNAAKKYLAAFPEIIRRMEEGDFVTALLAEMGFGQRSFAGFLKGHPEQYQQLIETRRTRPIGWRRFAPEHYAQSLARLVVDVSTPVDAFMPEGLPSYQAMVARCVHHPEFAEAFASARRERIAKRCELASIAPKPRKRQDAARPVYGTAMLRGQLLQDELYRAADAAVSRHLPDRDDVMADLIEAALNGAIQVGDMALQAAEFVTAHNRRIGFAKALSLDAKVSDDGDATFIESLTSDDYSYAD
jgi:hypothetical protein